VTLVNAPCQSTLRPTACKNAYKTLDNC